MATTYTLADQRIEEVLRIVLEAHHPALHAAGVKIGLLLAYNPDGPAVRHHGAEAIATIKVVALRDRVTKGYDAELILDQGHCGASAGDAHLNAILDHELCHLEIVLKQGKIARDDLGRPKLKLRPGDWDAGDGFRDVVARHGEFAVEFLNLQRATAAAEAALQAGDAA